MLVGAVRGGIRHRGTILYRNAELVRELQFYIERRPLARGYNSKFSYLECVGAGNVEGLFPLQFLAGLFGLQFYIGGVFSPLPGTSAQ